MEEANDNLLMQIAGRAGSIDNLLDAFFGFMNRRTDFYTVVPDEVAESKMGFRKGVAEKMVLNKLRSYPFKTIPAKNVPTKKTEATPVKAPQSPPTQVDKETPKAKALSDPEKKTQPYQIPGNGGVTDRYYWSQTLEDLTIYVDVPDGTKAKEIKCNIGAKELTIETPKGVLLKGEYPDPERVKASESLWSFEKATNTLVLSLDKTRETWWSCILKGEPEIDTKKVDSSRRVQEYDEATQAQIRKIMFDQQQQRKGLPTSDEIVKEEILEKAKHLPGSPFLKS
mmetsp:Transcript_19698/g.32368  ORF Transcript_19698/g.32368 Transcript_19698/m.32368 type:complete len:283 (+) Transcript_19698:231-1079(+)